MSQPVTAPPEHPRRAPSITRVFTAAFLAIAVAVLADRYVTWQSARRAQADMVALSHRLEQLERLHPSLGLEAQIQELRELAADVGDEAIQTAVQTTVILAIVPRAANSDASSPGFTAFKLSITTIMGLALFAAIRLSMMKSMWPWVCHPCSFSPQPCSR